MKNITNIGYTFYDKGMLRVPFFPIDYIEYIDDIDFLLSIKPLKEAIYIASPSLFEDLYTKDMRTEKTIMSFLRFFIRSCTRSTPFGLFAGCGIINLSNESLSCVKIEQEVEYRTYSRVDLEYLCDLIRFLEQNENIKDKLRYHINTTLYHTHNKLRYIEYNSFKGKRKYSFSEVKLSHYLDYIIQMTTLCPRTIEELANEIISADITLIDAKEFINELIDSQILISEFEPSVSGSDLIIQLKNKLDRLGVSIEYVDKIIALLNLSDKMRIGTRCNIYNEIAILLSKFFPNPKKNCLHVDCMIPSKQSFISNQICEVILKGIYILNYLTPSKKNDHLRIFKEVFFKRYDNQEIPLVMALDPQVGVGFGNWEEIYGDLNPLINDLTIQSNNSQSVTVELDFLTQFLISKYELCIKNKENSITITDDDLKHFKNNNIDKLPNQIYTLVKIVDIHEDNLNTTIFINGFSGSSSINLFTRFGYLNKDIDDFVRQVTNDETRFFENKIIAEISHLPEDRIGNIQMHPSYREYEIPYISNPYNEESVISNIPVSDILISVPNGQEIILRSKRYNKEIIPRLSTAHNYMTGLPIYHFLCSIQNQNSQGLYFDWGPYFNTKQFLPRVIYENIILSTAKWRITDIDLPPKDNASFDDYYVDLIEWKNSKGIPDLVEIIEYDNTLLIDFSKKTMMKIFINYVEKKKVCTIGEYLFVDKERSFARRGNSHFANELVLCLHKI